VLTGVIGALLDDRKRIGWGHIFLVFTPSVGVEHFLVNEVNKGMHTSRVGAS